MRQFVIIGLGSFGVRTLENLMEVTEEIIIVDKDEEIVERYKDHVRSAYVADASDEQALQRIIPEGVDAVIVDLGGTIEASILVTNKLKKLKVQSIIVKTDSDERGEILRLVGATRVVYPDREAASQLVPMLVSPSLFNYMRISENLVMAEVKVPEEYVGRTLIEANFRQTKGINVIAIRKQNGPEYNYFKPDYHLQNDDVLLVAGKESDVGSFTGIEVIHAKRRISDVLQGIFGREKH